MFFRFSLTAALNAARPGCGEIRRILTSSQFRPRLPGTPSRRCTFVQASMVQIGLTKLVSRLSREGHWQKGLEVFESLPEMGLTPDTTITNAAISACDRGGQWEKALQIFYNMDNHGLCRDTITYSSVISALSKGRQCSLAIDVFNHMMNANVHPDAVTCCSLISALDKGLFLRRVRKCEKWDVCRWNVANCRTGFYFNVCRASSVSSSVDEHGRCTGSPDAREDGYCPAKRHTVSYQHFSCGMDA